MQNLVDLLDSRVVKIWIKQYSGLNPALLNSLHRYHIALKTLACVTDNGNIPDHTLPLGLSDTNTAKNPPEVLVRFARFINCQAKLHALPAPFYEVKQKDHLPRAKQYC